MADLKRAESILDWRPRFSFEDGLTPTITWYTANRDPTFARENLDKVIYERTQFLTVVGIDVSDYE